MIKTREQLEHELNRDVLKMRIIVIISIVILIGVLVFDLALLRNFLIGWFNGIPM